VGVRHAARVGTRSRGKIGDEGARARRATAEKVFSALDFCCLSLARAGTVSCSRPRAAEVGNGSLFTK